MDDHPKGNEDRSLGGIGKEAAGKNGSLFFFVLHRHNQLKQLPFIADPKLGFRRSSDVVQT